MLKICKIKALEGITFAWEYVNIYDSNMDAFHLYLVE